jgi:hypothetical protein
MNGSHGGFLKIILVFALRKFMRNLTEDSWYQLRVKVSFRDEVRVVFSLWQ